LFLNNNQPAEKGGVMAESERTRAMVFGEVAELYHRARPTFPPALVDHVLDAVTNPRPRVLEVGSGTGKATELFAPRVERIVCVEPDAAMIGVAGSVLADAANVEIVNRRFEDWSPGDERFDLVISAQAWHWVEPEAGVRIARGALVDDGAIAVFWNRPMSEGDPMRDLLDAAYHAIAPEIGDDQWFNKTVLDAAARAESISSSGHFGPLETSTFPWTVSYTTSEYLDLLLTYSNHRLLDPPVLERLLDAVGAVIDEAGGIRTVRYETFLGLALAV
jgi:SAM-dependent methyltransferase